MSKNDLAKVLSSIIKKSTFMFLAQKLKQFTERPCFYYGFKRK